MRRTRDLQQALCYPKAMHEDYQFLVFTAGWSLAQHLKLCAICETACPKNPEGACYMFDYKEGEMFGPRTK